MTTAVAAGILALIAARGAWQTVGALLVARWARRSRPLPDPGAGAGPELLVLVPVLREQASLPRFVEAASCCVSADRPATVVVVTTGREAADRDRALQDVPGTVRLLREHPARAAAQLRTALPASSRREVVERIAALPGAEAEAELRAAIEAVPTTLDVARSLRGRYGPHPGLSMRIVEAPAGPGGKATQLAHALREVMAGRSGDDVLLAVYDVDSVPHPATFAAAAAEWRRRRRDGSRLTVLQQQRLPLLAPLDGRSASFWLRLEMLSQLRRSIAVEMRRLVEQLGLSRRPPWLRALLRPMVNCVGTGLFTTPLQVARAGGFLEPMEDLPFGFRTSLLGDGFAVSPVLCLDEAYVDYRDVINLHSRAFVVCATEPYRGLRATARATTLGTVPRLLLVGREYLEDAAWLLGPAAFAWAALTAGRSWAGLALSAAVLVLFCHAPTVATLVAIERMGEAVPAHDRRIRLLDDLAGTALAVACSPAFPLLRLPGAWRGLWLLFTADRGSSRFGKTER